MFCRAPPLLAFLLPHCTPGLWEGLSYASFMLGPPTLLLQAGALSLFPSGTHEVTFSGLPPPTRFTQTLCPCLVTGVISKHPLSGSQFPKAHGDGILSALPKHCPGLWAASKPPSTQQPAACRDVPGHPGKQGEAGVLLCPGERCFGTESCSSMQRGHTGTEVRQRAPWVPTVPRGEPALKLVSAGAWEEAGPREGGWSWKWGDQNTPAGQELG